MLAFVLVLLIAVICDIVCNVYKKISQHEPSSNGLKQFEHHNLLKNPYVILITINQQIPHINKVLNLSVNLVQQTIL